MARDILIVAEGDSWFRYLKYKAIPGHLKNLDPRYYLVQKAWPGDDFIEYIQRRDYLHTLRSWKGNGLIHHRFLLLSGGGNDLMKDHFQEYLDPASANFLNATFEKKMAQLIATYDLVFQLLAEQFPDVKVLVHGYDCPIPVASGPWLGNKMTKMGVDYQQHGVAIMKTIIDKFNHKLKDLEAQYPNVTYIDLRGMTGGHSVNWDNEIHPTKDIFEQMAQKFHHEIQSKI